MKKQLLRIYFKQKLLLLFICAAYSLKALAITNVSGNQSGTWTKANSPYVIIGNVTVPAGQKLIIQPGVEVRSLKYDDELVVNGILYAVGTPVDSIRFNGFANTAYAPASTHGGLIFFNSTNTTDSTVLAYVAMDRMGDKDYWSGDQAALEVNSGKISVRNSSIRNSEYRGIFGSGGASGLRVSKSNIFNNKYGGDFTLGKPYFYKCNIYGNTLFGINNTSTVVLDTIDARTCWWGDASGSKQTSTNPLGKGNPVSLTWRSQNQRGKRQNLKGKKPKLDFLFFR